MRWMDRLHNALVVERRARVLSAHIAPLIPEHAWLLDVGAGDARIASRLLQLRPDIQMTCVDVLVRPVTALPVLPYDGTRLPFRDFAFDCALLVDVVHHAEEPRALLKEAKRVASRCILLKDHLLQGLLARQTLRLMDEVGNVRHGVALRYNYWTPAEWRAALAALGLTATCWRIRLGIYPWPADLVFGRSLHFVARLERNEEGTP